MDPLPELAGMRWQLLRALRDMDAGIVLVVQADHSKRERRAVFFEGQPLPQLTASVLLKLGWVRPKCDHWMPNASFYELSPSGLGALEAGLRWWHSQPLSYRLVLRLTE